MLLLIAIVYFRQCVLVPVNLNVWKNFSCSFCISHYPKNQSCAWWTRKKINLWFQILIFKNFTQSVFEIRDWFLFWFIIHVTASSVNGKCSIDITNSAISRDWNFQCSDQLACYIYKVPLCGCMLWVTNCSQKKFVSCGSFTSVFSRYSCYWPCFVAQVIWEWYIHIYAFNTL